MLGPELETYKGDKFGMVLCLRALGPLPWCIVPYRRAYE